MSLKKTAEELLKIADQIEKDAAEVTKFVCASCNHTATLAKINELRHKNALSIESETGKSVVVSDLTVNDLLQCPACEGTMSYSPTKQSSEYYFDETKLAENKDAEPDSEEKESEKKSEEEVEKTPVTAKKTKEEDEDEDDEEEDEEDDSEDEEEDDDEDDKSDKKASIDYDKLDMYLKG